MGRKRRSSGTAGMQLLVLWLVMRGAWDVAALTPGQCKEERNRIEEACRSSFLAKQNVSPACCQRVRVTHFVECICPISPKLASLIRAYGVKRLVGEIRRCGGTIPRNYKCGSITTPP
ncbi:hypothetical protein EUGRSUZ_K00115 [Eucalyptus grandis]|uniref:Uncharacterized protein n=3 Tax=Eucalyptus TaxID=3932 RepID=A0ACC3IP73_EUCGR|nr:hypothetical protein EUGRSUZ_K00115 [Eucalyptus grandis]